MQQCIFMPHMIRGENNRMTKRLIFNDDGRKKTGSFVTLYKTVLENKKVTPDIFNKTRCPEGSRACS